MTPGKFLRLIWPQSGFYCIAHPFAIPGTDVVVYQHHVFDTISAAASHCYGEVESRDVYFAVLTLKDAQIWDPTKTDHKTGDKGAWAVRLQSNSYLARCLFWDLDVGVKKGKYPTQADALQALNTFMINTGMPMPTMVSSGGGVHCYWHFDADMPVEEWRDLAYQLKQLGEAAGVLVDPQRTTDSSSVLRVSGTKNWKDKSNPRLVDVLQEGAVTPAATLRRIIQDALIARGVTPGVMQVKAAPAAVANPLGEQTFNDFGPPPTLDELAGACGQVRKILSSQLNPKHPNYGQLDNTAWYKGQLNILRWVQGGDDLCRHLTAMHPRTNADIETKLRQLALYAPAQCDTLQQIMPWGDKPCQTCQFGREGNRVKNPLIAARKTVAAPPPGSTASQASAPPPLPSPAASSPTAQNFVAPSQNLLAAMIPDPPKPFKRLKAGGIGIDRLDKDGNETTTRIYDNDLYPLRRLVNSEGQTEQQVWRVTLPRAGARDFIIDADTLYDSRKFAAALSHNGVYPNKADIPALQDYMVAYITQLQKTLDADSQMSHLGWTDGYRKFVLPEKTFCHDGRILTSSLTTAARNATQQIEKRGNAQRQIELLGFYNDPAYAPNQFAILCSFASAIFSDTGHYGIVVNMSGASGASKSTTLYAAASAWGDSALLPINGTNVGATAKARAQRPVIFGNVPTCVDEITHLPTKEVQDLVMNITQPGNRLRLGTDGAEKATGENYKSGIMIATANTSLHAVLSTDNAAGTAGSMRVFEIKMLPQRVHTKAQADQFLSEIKEHFGHLGEPFVRFVVMHREQVRDRVRAVMREIDQEASIQSSERYWSAVIAVVLVACEICNALGILAYPREGIKRWAIDVQIPSMRGTVKEEYRDPLAILTDYMAEKQNGIVVIKKSTSIGANTGGTYVAANVDFAENRVNGALLGHYDVEGGTMFLLKQAFKEHCTKIGAISTRIIDDLMQPRGPFGQMSPVIVNKHIRKTLGAGTALAKGQTWCFVVDMTHPDIAGAMPVPVAANPAVVPSAPTGQLKAV